MSAPLDSSLLIVSEVNLNKIINNLELDAQRVKESVGVLREWCKKQDHFITKDVDDRILERLFILAKGSIEATKQKTDKLFSSRAIFSELTLNRSIDEFDKFFDLLNYVPLPKLSPTDLTRVMVTQFITNKQDDLSILSYFRYCFFLGDYRLSKDYSFAERYIFDCKNIGMPMLGKLNPVIVKKSEILCTESYGTQIKGIHILNAPTFIDKVIFILKQTLKEKVANRIFVHNSYEDLHKHIPKSILPADYNGDEPTVAKLAAQWKDELKTPEVRKYFQSFESLVTDESLRQNGTFNTELLGMQGSFRKLNVD